ncbi:hypothetical protein DV736_g1421, partial [Chaetothyriales sp. CBS 134916]
MASSTTAGTRFFARPKSLDETLNAVVKPNDNTSMGDANGGRSTEAAKASVDAVNKGGKGKPGITYASQDKLPKLPIPDLESTMKKYLESLAPLQSAREHEETRAAARDFQQHDGVELQDKLKKYASNKTSYIEQFWYDSYLNYDNPVVLNLNPFFLLEDDPTPARNNQVTRAASLVISSLCFVRAVRKEELPPDTIRGTPLDMYQFSRMFGTARVPTEHGCVIGQDSDSKHVVVMCRGQFYWFDVLDENNDLIMGEKDLAVNLQVIVDDAMQTPIQEAAKGAIGVLSTENRKTWSGLRDVLMREEGSNNAECLNIVDTALFVVCLDYTEPVDASQLCGNMLCGTNEVVKGVQVGTCTNRWYDKLQIIVCKNGSAGINFEHTGVDGHTVLRFASDVYTDTILRFARSINGQAPTLWTSSSPDPSKRDPKSFGQVSTTPHKLEWDMIPELQIALRFAETRLADLIHQNEFQTLEFKGYGKNFITSMGLSPDAFVQMAFQASYYGLWGRVENTYEPAMTKIFLHGRTEAVRSVTKESNDFVKIFWADNPAQKKVDALKVAAQKHTTITRDCGKGQGFDRHLYALYCVWQRKVNEEGADVESVTGFSSNGYSSPTDTTDPGSPQRQDDSLSPRPGSRAGTDNSRSSNLPSLHQMPALFSDPGWEKMNNTVLSTSNCGNPSLRHFGFGPVSGDGFGIGYIVKDESISVCASSKHRQTKRFIDSIESYLLEIRRLLKATRPRDAATAKSTRAREVDYAGRDGHQKARGRVIKAESLRADGEAKGTRTPMSIDTNDVDDDDLGGYGFFDAGMLLQALKKKDKENPPAEPITQRRTTLGEELEGLNRSCPAPAQSHHYGTDDRVSLQVTVVTAGEAAAAADPLAPAGVGAAFMDQDKILAAHTPLPQVHTPPTTDEGSRSHKDDDAASSSSLSDLGDDLDDEGNRLRFEDAARAGAEAEQHTEIKPDRYENGVPIFTPTMEEFRDFEKYVRGVDPYGMQHGIVLIDPPEEWKQQRKPLDQMVKNIKIKNPITQEFHGTQGIYTQRNMEKMRSYNLPQWKAICEQTENQPPARRGEKRLNADKLLGRGSSKAKKEGNSGASASGKRTLKQAKTNVKTEPVEPDSSLLAPPTPTSPDVKPAESPEEADEEENGSTPVPAPAKAKSARKSTPKPKTRAPRSAGKKEAKGSETSVAARRLHNAQAAAGEIDEAAFAGFDYRVYDNDQWTAERCDELEDKYWKSLSFSNPMYAADMPGSLFDDDTTCWNVAKLPNLLDLLGQPIPGVNTAYLYLGMWRATFAWHLEDVDLYSINYIHFGAPKQWYSISQKDAPKFENAMKSIWGQDAKTCDQFLRHKTYLVSPSILKQKFGVTVNKVVHREGQFVITFPIGYHSGYNLGYNCAESVNFAIENWLQYGRTARKCYCEADSVFIDVDWFVRKLNGETTPEYEEVEVTDDEDDDQPADLPTPPASDRGKINMCQKRKRAPKDAGPNKKAKKIIKIRKVSKNSPCCLCPNDFAWEELLPTTHGQRAHRTCAMYTPETYIAKEDGQAKVFNVEGISKARLELKCYECRLKKGSCFQCSSAKCTKSYHATCAMQAGVQVDKGEIAIWHEGVEYRDIGFDWRCRLHRSVKRTRITSELSTCNHANNCWANKEFIDFINNLSPGELIQYQSTHVDDIEAGVVETAYDPDQGSVLVKVLPEQKILKEVDPAWILFVDSATSCLQKPSANALDLPEELQAKAASLPESTERKPSEGDPFTQHPKTEWAEFVSNAPPFNKAQKKVDINKPKSLWIYLGESSSDFKAFFTADPNNRVHDPASAFLSSVEPPRRTMAPPAQPHQQSLAARHPHLNITARNAASVSFGQPLIIQDISDRRQLTPAHYNAMNQAKDSLPRKRSQLKDVSLGAEAKANEQARILQRQQLQARQFVKQGQPPLKPSSMGVDQEAVERQKQFQIEGSQHSRKLQQHIPHGQDPVPSYIAMQHSGYDQQIARQSQYNNDWITPTAGHGRPSFNQRQSPQMQPVAHFGHQSPTMNGVHRLPGYGQQSQAEFPHIGEHLSPQMDGTDTIHAATGQAAQPPPSAAVERLRRISNPAYPFKSPDLIKAQKEAEKASPPNSRPSSSYMLQSPGMQHDISFLHDSSVQLQFINPNATQISPPGSSAGPSSAVKSMSTTASAMGMPMHPQHSRSASATLGNPAFCAVGSVSSYIPRRSMFDPLYKSNPPIPQPIPQPQPAYQPPKAPMAEPHPQLVAATQPRLTILRGYPVNDHPVAEQYCQWQQKAGFWGRIADYYVRKHEVKQTVYRSPFTARPYGPDLSDAQAFYQRLDESNRTKIDEYMQSNNRQR